MSRDPSRARRGMPQPDSRCSAVRWSRLISRTWSAVSTGSPPRSSIRANASRSSTVDTSPAAPSWNDWPAGSTARPAGPRPRARPQSARTPSPAARRPRCRSRCRACRAARRSGCAAPRRTTSRRLGRTARSARARRCCRATARPGCASRGSSPNRAIQVSGSTKSSGCGGPIVASPASAAAATTGHGSGAMNISRAIPNPNVNVSNPRTVTGPSAGTVSSSGPSIRRSTRRFASSGSSRSTGSSRSSRPSRTRASVAAAVIGFVVDAIRNSDVRSTGLPPTASVPSASTCTSSPRATSATSPGTLSSPTCEAATAPNRSSPSLFKSHAHSNVVPIADNIRTRRRRLTHRPADEMPAGRPPRQSRMFSAEAPVERPLPIAKAVREARGLPRFAGIQLRLREVPGRGRSGSRQPAAARV